MRLGRIGFILLAIYFIFIGGSAYYNLIFPIKILHHIVVTCLVGIWFIGRIRRGIGFPKTPLNLPILAAVIAWFISAFSSTDPRMAFENLWFPLTHVVFFFILVDMFQHRKQRLVMEAVFMVSAVVIIFSGAELASWYFGLGIIPNTEIGWIDVLGTGAWLPLRVIRLSLAMNISTLLAGFVAPLVTVATAWAWTTHRRDNRIVLWILTAGLLVVLILTFSRGGLLSLVTAVGVLGLFRVLQAPRLRESRIPLRPLAGIGLALGLVLLSVYSVTAITGSRTDGLGDAGRLDMWQSAVEMTRDQPIAGVGPGLFGRAFRDYRNPTIVQEKLASAHNAYLNTAAETGLLGIGASLWLAIAFVKAWYQNWRGEAWPGRRLRLEATLAALLGIGAHSLVDVFTITPIVLLILVLVAYCITERRATTIPNEAKRHGSIDRLFPILALVLTAGYVVWLFQLDRAQSNYMSSLRDSERATTYAQAAVDLDPGLKLYQLQLAYLKGQDALQNSNPDWGEASQAYQYALELEPTWDTGWINLAAIELRRDNPSEALAHLDRARQINIRNLASLHWAKLAETMQAAPEAEIIAAYTAYLGTAGILPLSDFWWDTELRRGAVERYLANAPLDIEYRVFVVHEPERAEELLPESPSTAAEWWVLGEYTLTVESNNQKATEYFSRAIELAPTNGDYYASRARAVFETDPSVAKRDLDLASLLGTVHEYPNAIRAKMAATPEETHRLQANALPPQTILQEFAAVLYGRPAVFDVFPDMKGIGPGRAAMQPLYELAENYEAAGDYAGAVRVYLFILGYAPDEQEARERLQQF